MVKELYHRLSIPRIVDISQTLAALKRISIDSSNSILKYYGVFCHEIDGICNFLILRFGVGIDMCNRILSRAMGTLTTALVPRLIHRCLETFLPCIISRSMAKLHPAGREGCLRKSDSASKLDRRARRVGFRLGYGDKLT